MYLKMMKLNDLYPGVGTDIIIKRISINSKEVDTVEEMVNIIDKCNCNNYDVDIRLAKLKELFGE